MKVKVISRPPGDLFTVKLFNRLVQDIKKPADVIYLWTLFVDKNSNSYSDISNELYSRQELVHAIKNDLVVIGIKDHFTSGWFNPYTDSRPNILEYFEQMFEFYKEKTFIVFTSTENLIIDNPRVHVVNWGGDLTNQKYQYQQLSPVIDKNLNSNYSFISLNRNNRPHRILALSTLYGLNLNTSGFITYMSRELMPSQLNDMNCVIDQDLLPVLQTGFEKLKTAKFTVDDDYLIYPNSDNDNVSNFKNCLSNYYRETFVEIITETSFTEPCYLLTEKTLNSIYGCNFPILLCSQGAVAFLRNMGIDVFDDVIDHSYDQISDPVQRLYFAIERNKEILNNVDLAKKLWLENKQRFLKNVEFVRKGLYDFYQTRAEQQWNDLRYIYDYIS